MKIKVLANDGISQAGIDLLSQNNYEVITDNVEQERLIDYINENNISCLLVRSATKVRKDIIDSIISINNSKLANCDSIFFCICSSYYSCSFYS